MGSMNANTPSSTIWKRFRSIDGKAGKKINQVKNGRGVWLQEDSEKAEAFNDHYKCRAGKKVSWPKLLTHEEMGLSARFGLAFFDDDEANAPFTMAELKMGIF